MENPKLIKSLLFLEDCLNNKLEITKSTDFELLLKALSNTISQTSFKVGIRVKSLGKKCENCNRYIHHTHLSKAIKLENTQYVCSILCNREFTNSQSNKKKRKETDESTNSSCSEEQNILSQVRGCRCVII